jgi:hypothetical protein
MSHSRQGHDSLQPPPSNCRHYALGYLQVHYRILRYESPCVLIAVSQSERATRYGSFATMGLKFHLTVALLCVDILQLPLPNNHTRREIYSPAKRVRSNDWFGCIPCWRILIIG